MIGNDVVDLGDADSRVAGHHPRFDDRVFAPAERALIAAGPEGERVRWLLWAAKESAYKAARRATVEAAGRTFDVELRGDDEHVQAIARGRDDARAAVYSAVARLAGTEESTPSAAVRRLTMTTLARLLAVSEPDLALDRDGRLPRLWIRGRLSPAELSLSHHGRFVAFACRWPGERGRA
jgi:phosphopantetheinyl transferase (holo-ACP synthase)